MRLQSKKTLQIRDKILGGPVPLTCLPLVATDQASLLDQATDVCSFDPDAIEWRVDKFDAVCDTEVVLGALGALRDAIGNIPLIFTCRVIHEGGFQEIAPADRLRLNQAVIASGLADLIDTEISNGEAMVAEVKAACRKAGSRLILSYHNFDETPDEAFILDRLVTAGKLGARRCQSGRHAENVQRRADPAQRHLHGPDRTTGHPHHYDVHGERGGHYPHRRRAVRLRSHVCDRQGQFGPGTDSH